MARKTMSHLAVVPVGDSRIACLKSGNLASENLTSGSSSAFGREASGSLPVWSRVGISSGWVGLGF